MFRLVNTFRTIANSQVIGQRATKLTNLCESRLLRTVMWNHCPRLERKQFHTSPIRNVPPLLLLLAKPLGKVVAVVFGKTLKRWWIKLPPERRKVIWLGVKENRWKFLTAFGLIPTGFFLYYVAHLEVDPITGRKRFIVINEEQLLTISKLELDSQIELHRNNFLSPSHPVFKRVTNVCNRLLKSNNDLKQIQSRQWLVTVVDEPDIRNAFVYPSGHIFIFTGLLAECTTDDMLGVIVAHEISHVILNHAAEQISSLGFLDMVLTIPILLIWAILPDAGAVLMHSISDYFSKLMFSLPFSRTLETEADNVGLQIAAKACFDVRAASAFWKKMALREGEEVEWLSTHPNSETRHQYLDQLMPQVIKFREECKCPRLPATDPRNLVPHYHQSISSETRAL